MQAWQRWVPDAEAACRAGGRRRHNAARQRHAQTRREEVRQLLDRWAHFRAGAGQNRPRPGREPEHDHPRRAGAGRRPPLPVICPLCHLPSRFMSIPPA